MPQCAVLTSDLQYDLVNKSEERLSVVEAAIPRLASFLSSVRNLGVPVVHLQLVNLPDDPQAERYDGWLPATRESKGVRVLDELVAPTDIVLEKHKPSGFFGTDLDSILRNLGVDTVVVTGMHTQICVQTTAADAFFHGFRVIVPPDAVVSVRDDDRERALHWLQSFCATLIPMDQLLAAIADDNLPAFETVPVP